MSYRTIDASELRPADIFVTTGRALISGTIRLATGTDYSHTVLYLGGGRVIEAIADGVVERDLNEPLSEATLAVALRRRYMTEDARKIVVQTAKNFKGKAYDYVGAAGAGLTHKRGQLIAFMNPKSSLALFLAAMNNASDDNKDKKFFCSELAARCYEIAGLPISEFSPSFTTPRSVRVSQQLLYIGHLVGGP